MLTESAERLKLAVREVLGEAPSPIFMARIDRMLDEGTSDGVALAQAAERVERLVKLFISEEKARAIGARCRDILKTNG